MNSNCIPLPLKPKLHWKLPSFYLSSPSSAEPVAPSDSLSVNLFLSISLWLMCTARIINGDHLNLIFLSFNLCSSCLTALPGHLGNLHHYRLSPALYLPLAYFVPGMMHNAGTGPLRNSLSVCLSVCLGLLRTLSPPVFCRMTAAPSWWTTLPANGRLRLTQRRRGGVP